MESEPFANYQLWNFIVQTLSALGTVAAVIVALYIARKSNMPVLKIYAGFRVLVDDDKHIDLFTISVDNTSPVNTTITGFFWKIPWQRGFHWQGISQDLSLYTVVKNSSLPFTLNDSNHRASYFLNKDILINDCLSKMVEEINRTRYPIFIKKYMLRNMKFQVRTIHRIFSIKIEESIKSELLPIFERLQAEKKLPIKQEGNQEQ